MKKSIALATSEELPNLFEEDRPLLAELRARGFEVSAEVWSRPVDWTAYQAVLIRSCWDYHERREQFLGWAEELERSGIKLWNPSQVLRQNTEKTYLRGLADLGLPVLPTLWPENEGELPLLDEALGRWSEVVIKPTISAGARDTYRVNRTQIESGKQWLASILRRSGAMIQPFCRSILELGEVSLLFFGGKLSHAVRKQGPPGEFRIQHQYGGTTTGIIPPPDYLRVANRVVMGELQELVYARVDLIEWAGRPVLIELELTEPNLFLSADPLATSRMAEEIARRLGK